MTYKIIITYIVILIAILFAYDNYKENQSSVNDKFYKNKIDSLRVVSDSLYQYIDSIGSETKTIIDTIEVVRTRYIKMKANYNERIKTSSSVTDSVVVCSVNISSDVCQRFFSNLTTEE